MVTLAICPGPWATLDTSKPFQAASPQRISLRDKKVFNALFQHLVKHILNIGSPAAFTYHVSSHVINCSQMAVLMPSVSAVPARISLVDGHLGSIFQLPITINTTMTKNFRDFPGGTVVKNPPANAGDTGSSPGPGRSHMPWSS